MPSTFELSYRQPFDWEQLLAYLPTRGIPGVETVISGSYARTFEIAGRRGWLTVRNLPSCDALQVTVASGFSKFVKPITAKLRRLFDLDADPALIASHLGKDPLLAPTLVAYPGLRIPGTWEFFELSIRAILGQQISIARATALAGRLADRFGQDFATPIPALERICFTPQALAAVTPEELAAIGIPLSRGRTLHRFAQASVAGKLDFPPATPLATILATLQELPGIGPWTANYIAMRGLGQPDAFPTADLGLLKATHLKSARALDAIAEKWRPWRSYAALHLWRSLYPLP